VESRRGDDLWLRGEEMIGKHYRVIVPAELETRGELDWLAEEMRQRNFVRIIRPNASRKMGGASWSISRARRSKMSAAK